MANISERLPILGVVVVATRDADGELIYLEAGAGGGGSGGEVTQGTSPWVMSSTQLATLLTLIGEVSATPTANTVLDRLKDIADALGIDLDVVLKNSSGTEIGTDANPIDVQQAALDVDVDDVSVAGKIAHGDADTGATSRPVGIGYRAIAHGANPTAVDAADRTVGYANRAGIPFVIGGHPNVQTVEATVLDTDGAQTNAALVTVSAGTKIVVTCVSITASNANSGNVACRVGFGAASLGAAALAGVAGIVASHPNIPAGGGMTKGDGSGILGIGGDGEDLRFTCADPAGGSLVINVSYYTIES